jgi:3-hydroxyisobutyrate dehydrogenase
MVGGDEAAFDRAEPVVRAYAKAIRRMGGPGAGQLTKMVNQICIAGVVQGLAEAVSFADRAGLNAELVYQAISQGAAQSWQMDNRWATMSCGEFDFGFAVDWMRKDLGLVLAEARANGARLEITALVDQFYAEVQAMGGRRWDTSSLAARLQAPSSFAARGAK